MRLPETLHAQALGQCGVLTVRSLRGAGVRSRQISNAVRDGHWQRATSAVLVTHPLALNRETWLWIAALHFEGFVLAGTSALELDGFPTPSHGRIHLIGPRGGQSAPRRSWTLHTSAEPLAVVEIDDPGIPRRPPAVGVAAATAQAMGWATTDRQAVFVATWAIQRKLTTLDQLRATLPSRSRNAADVRARHVLEQIDPGVHSVNEFDFALECGRRGLPTPLRQVLRRDSEGRARYTDCEFLVGDKRLIVEIDGLQHLDTSVREDDQWRANEFTIQGAYVIRVSSLALRANPNRFFAQLTRMLEALTKAA